MDCRGKGSKPLVEHDSELLREGEVKSEYRFSGAWLRKRRWLGLPPAFVRIGCVVLYERRELNAFVQSQRVEPNRHEVRR